VEASKTWEGRSVFFYLKMIRSLVFLLLTLVCFGLAIECEDDERGYTIMGRYPLNEIAECSTTNWTGDHQFATFRDNLDQWLRDYKHLIADLGITIVRGWPVKSIEHRLGHVTRLMNRLMTAPTATWSGFTFPSPGSWTPRCVSAEPFNLTSTIEQALPSSLRRQVKWHTYDEETIQCTKARLRYYRTFLVPRLTPDDPEFIDCISGHTCDFS
jgi:hypothetical protein